MNFRKQFLMVRVVWQWTRLLGEVMDSPSKEIFKHSLCSTIYRQAVGLDYLESTFQLYDFISATAAS